VPTVITIMPETYLCLPITDCSLVFMIRYDNDIFIVRSEAETVDLIYCTVLKTKKIIRETKDKNKIENFRSTGSSFRYRFPIPVRSAVKSKLTVL